MLRFFRSPNFNIQFGQSFLCVIKIAQLSKKNALNTVERRLSGEVGTEANPDNRKSG